MYTIYDIDDEANKSAVIFRFNGKTMMVDNGLKQTEISREELENLIDWLKICSEKLNRDYWDKLHEKTSNPVCCDCVRPA